MCIGTDGFTLGGGSFTKVKGTIVYKRASAKPSANREHRTGNRTHPSRSGILRIGEPITAGPADHERIKTTELHYWLRSGYTRVDRDSHGRFDNTEPLGEARYVFMASAFRPYEDTPWLEDMSKRDAEQYEEITQQMKAKKHRWPKRFWRSSHQIRKDKNHLQPFPDVARVADVPRFLQLAKPLTWDLVNSRFARLKCNRARTAFQEEHKANKTYRRFYRQSAFPAMTFSNLQRREAPLSTCNHC